MNTIPTIDNTRKNLEGKQIPNYLSKYQYSEYKISDDEYIFQVIELLKNPSKEFVEFKFKLTGYDCDGVLKALRFLIHDDIRAWTKIYIEIGPNRFNITDSPNFNKYTCWLGNFPSRLISYLNIDIIIQIKPVQYRLEDISEFTNIIDICIKTYYGIKDDCAKEQVEKYRHALLSSPAPIKFIPYHYISGIMFQLETFKIISNDYISPTEGYFMNHHYRIENGSIEFDWIEFN